MACLYLSLPKPPLQILVALLHLLVRRLRLRPRRHGYRHKPVFPRDIALHRPSRCTKTRVHAHAHQKPSTWRRHWTCMVTGDLCVSVQTEQHTRVCVCVAAAVRSTHHPANYVPKRRSLARTFNFLMVLQHCAVCPCRWDSLAPGPSALASDNWAFLGHDNGIGEKKGKGHACSRQTQARSERKHVFFFFPFELFLEHPSALASRASRARGRLTLRGLQLVDYGVCSPAGTLAHCRRKLVATLPSEFWPCFATSQPPLNSF